MKTRLSIVALAVLATACASLPSGPEVMALPGTGRSFDDFRNDDIVCRDYAMRQIGGPARERSANTAVVSSAAVGAAVGALAGAAIGGRDGAGVGAGTGLIVGGLAGTEGGQSLRGGQRQYDHAYVQCMYGKGHRVPVNGVYTSAPAAPAPATIPPPPVGMPPPPPAR